MKKTLITLIATAALLSLTAFAFAAPHGGGHGYAAKGYHLTAEQRATIQKIIEAHQDKLYDLREKIWAKQAELQALTTSGKAEKSDIQSLIGEISKLRDAMHQERLAIRTEIQKQTGLKPFGPNGYHHGMMGLGYGDGSGCPGGGFGRGFGGACPGGACN